MSLPVQRDRTGNSEETAMTIDSSAQIRVIRAFLGMSSRDFAARLGVSTATLTAYEHGRTAPQGSRRQVLAELCRERDIGLLPSGMPVPFAECFALKPGEFTGWDSPSPGTAASATPAAGGAESGGADPAKRASADAWDPTAFPPPAPRRHRQRITE
jgi:transcriptional regulator with XRE-family HTH domain